MIAFASGAPDASRHKARPLPPDARADDARPRGAAHRVTHRVARGGPPQLRVLLDPPRARAVDQAIGTLGQCEERAVDADDAGLDAARAEIDGEQTVGHSQGRSAAVPPR